MESSQEIDDKNNNEIPQNTKISEQKTNQSAKNDSFHNIIKQSSDVRDNLSTPKSNYKSSLRDSKSPNELIAYQQSTPRYIKSTDINQRIRKNRSLSRPRRQKETQTDNLGISLATYDTPYLHNKPSKSPTVKKKQKGWPQSRNRTFTKEQYRPGYSSDPEIIEYSIDRSWVNNQPSNNPNTIQSYGDLKAISEHDISDSFSEKHYFKLPRVFYHGGSRYYSRSSNNRLV